MPQQAHTQSCPEAWTDTELSFSVGACQRVKINRILVQPLYRLGPCSTSHFISSLQQPVGVIALLFLIHLLAESHTASRLLANQTTV